MCAVVGEGYLPSRTKRTGGLFKKEEKEDNPYFAAAGGR